MISRDLFRVKIIILKISLQKVKVLLKSERRIEYEKETHYLQSIAYHHLHSNLRFFW